MYHIVTESVRPYNSCSKGVKKLAFLEIYILMVQKVLNVQNGKALKGLIMLV